MADTTLTPDEYREMITKLRQQLRELQEWQKKAREIVSLANYAAIDTRLVLENLHSDFAELDKP